MPTKTPEKFSHWLWGAVCIKLENYHDISWSNKSLFIKELIGKFCSMIYYHGFWGAVDHELHVQSGHHTMACMMYYSAFQFQIFHIFWVSWSDESEDYWQGYLSHIENDNFYKEDNQSSGQWSPIGCTIYKGHFKK